MIFGFGEEKNAFVNMRIKCIISYSDLYADLENIRAYAVIQNA